MGREELASALKKKGEAEVKAIRRQAEDEAERYRQQRRREVEQKGLVCDREADRTARQECRQVDWRVAKQVRNLRLKALREIDRRLWQLLLDEVDRLGQTVRSALLDELTAELPEHAWESVTVHPADAGHAASLFPGCRILTDSTVGAGLIVEKDGGDIRVDNSLRCRLQKLWPKFSGEILAKLEAQNEGVRT